MAEKQIGSGISFIIPALNEELLIGRCIKSIKAEIKRSYINAEIIVVDNGSTDATPFVAAVKGATVVKEPHRGIVHAKAKGLAESRYHLVAFIDADCMLREGWIGRVIDQFADIYLVGLSGPYRYYDLRFGRHAANSVFALYKLASRVMPIMIGGNVVARRSAIEKIGGLDTSFTFWGEDTKLAIELAKVGKVKFDFGLRVDSSGRRLIEQGYVSTLWSYLLNTFSVRFFGRAALDRHEDFR